MGGRLPSSMIKVTLGLMLGFAAAPTTEQPRGQLAFEHVSIVDLATGSVLPDMLVVVDAGRIASITDAKAAGAQPGATVVDATGKYMIPGLWDMHVHTTDRSYLPQFVAHGVTGVRDMGGGLSRPTDGCESVEPATLQAWRAEVERGELVGPRILLSGPVVSGTGWPTSLSARTPEEAVAAVASLEALRVDFVKVYEKISLESYLALANAAKASGMVIAGHVPVETVGLLDAIHAGQRSIEHIRDPLLMCFTAEKDELSLFFAQDGWSEADVEWGWLAHAQCPDILSAVSNHAVWFTPTLVVEHAKVAVEGPRWAEKRLQSWLPRSVRDAHAKYARDKRAQMPEERASEHRWWEAQKKMVGRLMQSGASLLAGTDSACEGGLPGEDLHSELELLVEAGLTPRQALAAATLEPARYFESGDERGLITAGARADLVLLDGNPLEDISNTRRIHGVVLLGQWLDSSRLAALRDRKAQLPVEP